MRLRASALLIALDRQSRTVALESESCEAISSVGMPFSTPRGTGVVLLNCEMPDHAGEDTGHILRVSPKHACTRVASMGTDYATVARLLASPARSAVVDALMEGRPLAAGELAQVAGVRASTISEHLGELTEAGLLTVVRAGRHRYYQLASAEVADALEALSRICPTTPARSLRQSRADRSLLLARLCYDHLAGGLGVAMLDQMCSADWLVSDSGSSSGPDLEVTNLGMQALTDIGVDVDACRKARRHFARPCLDWSERRAHLAGALGAAMSTALLEGKWLRRTATGRGVQITDKGETGLRAVFKISIGDLDATPRPA